MELELWNGNDLGRFGYCFICITWIYINYEVIIGLILGISVIDYGTNSLVYELSTVPTNGSARQMFFYWI